MPRTATRSVAPAPAVAVAGAGLLRISRTYLARLVRDGRGRRRCPRRAGRVADAVERARLLRLVQRRDF